MMISEKFDKANAKIRKQILKDNALEKAEQLNITMNKDSKKPETEQCAISFVSNSTPSEMYKQLKEAILQATEQIDKETVWQSCEPDWWIEMMDLQKQTINK